MKYKLLCVDIDGTLLDDEKKIPMQVKKSLKNVSGKGMEIALVSGRMPAGVELVEKELGIECIKACSAGTYILRKERCISAEYLSNETMQDVYKRFMEKRKIPLWIFRGRDWLVTSVDKYVEREVEVISSRPALIDIHQLADRWKEENTQPNKLLVAADADQIPVIYREMKAYGYQDIDMACSSDTFIEIFPKGADKGKALRTICRELDISQSEAIAIGDQELDIPMIEAAGVGIAMGNAIAELKEKADFVTKTNNEAGIAYALENFSAWRTKGE